MGEGGTDLEANNKVVFLASVLVNVNQEILQPYSTLFRRVCSNSSVVWLIPCEFRPFPVAPNPLSLQMPAAG